MGQGVSEDTYNGFIWMVASEELMDVLDLGKGRMEPAI